MLLSNEELHATLLALGKASEESIDYLTKHPYQRGGNFPYPDESEHALTYREIIRTLNAMQLKLQHHAAALYLNSTAQ